MTKVLIVEDHADIRRLIRMTLEFEDYEIFEAHNGANGLAAAARLLPDVVLLDVMMPGELDGLDACRMLRLTPGLADVRVVILSASGRAADVQKGMAAGADAYLVKPFSPLELTRVVRSLAMKAMAAQ